VQFFRHHRISNEGLVTRNKIIKEAVSKLARPLLRNML
jgi:hypothetical protein